MTKLNAQAESIMAEELAALPVKPGRTGTPGVKLELPAEGTPARRVYEALQNNAQLLAAYGTRPNVGTHAMYRVWLAALVKELAAGTSADKLIGVRDRDMAASIGSPEYGPSRPTGPHNGTMMRNGRIAKTAIGYSLAGPIVEIASKLIAAESKPATATPDKPKKKPARGRYSEEAVNADKAKREATAAK